MSKLNYLGRPDGLDNRIEEIIQLEIISEKEEIEFNYIWNNQFRDRDYEILLSSKRVKVIKSPEGGAIIEKIPFQPNNFKQQEILDIAKNICPSFDIYFENKIKPVGIHIRGTDRIGQNHPHFMRDKNEFNSYLHKTAELLNTRTPPFIFICADQEEYRNDILRYLKKSIKVIEPICNPEIPQEYQDFFALTLCKEVYMCSRFSSFSITASLVGNIPLITFVCDEDVANRYKALFRYEINIKDNRTQSPFPYFAKFKLYEKAENKAIRIKKILQRIIKNRYRFKTLLKIRERDTLI